MLLDKFGERPFRMFALNYDNWRIVSIRSSYHVSTAADLAYQVSLSAPQNFASFEECLRNKLTQLFLNEVDNNANSWINIIESSKIAVF